MQATLLAAWWGNVLLLLLLLLHAWVRGLMRPWNSQGSG